MARTSGKGFYFRKSLVGLEHPATQDYYIAGSATLTIGDLVRVNTSGLLVNCATTEAPLGVLVGIVDQNGVNAFSPRAKGTSGATLTGDDTITTASTNYTDATKQLKGQVIVDVGGTNLYYNDADGDFTIASLFMMYDVADGDQVTTGGASDATGQVQLVVIDPDGDGDASKGLFRINESQFGGILDNATAKNAA